MSRAPRARYWPAMSSQDNVGIVKQLFTAAGRGDVEGVIDLVAPDGVIDASRGAFGKGSFKGHEQIRDYIASSADVWNPVGTEPEEFMNAGDAVIVLVRVVDTGRTSALTLATRAAWLAEVRDGKVGRMTVYQSRAEALEAVGRRD